MNPSSPSSASRPRLRGDAAFSLIELLVVLGIAGYLIAISFPKLSSLMSHYRLDGATRTLMAELQRARFRAIAERQCFKVKFDSPVPAGSYQLQKASATGACTSATYADEGGVKQVDSVNFLTLASAANPVFDTRGAVNTVSTITLTGPMGASRSVAVESSGRMRIQ